MDKKDVYRLLTDGYARGNAVEALRREVMRARIDLARGQQQGRVARQTELWCQAAMLAFTILGVSTDWLTPRPLMFGALVLVAAGASIWSMSRQHKGQGESDDELKQQIKAIEAALREADLEEEFAKAHRVVTRKVMADEVLTADPTSERFTRIRDHWNARAAAALKRLEAARKAGTLKCSEETYEYLVREYSSV